MLGVLDRGQRILVCVGPGGVGKTTTAAALAARAARGGRRTLVCTIDPAPRLADALGIPQLGAAPARLSSPARAALGLPADGDLFVARLDTAHAFARLVEEEIADPVIRRRIFANPIYDQITRTLTGSQEYAATLALHAFFRDGTWDLIVLDTPPTAHALDFLDAPRRIRDAATSPALRWFVRPATGGGPLSWRRLRSGGALVLQRLGKFVGSRFLDDLGAFLSDFHLVLGGFLERAQAIESLLRRPEVGFALVLVPEVPSVDEALAFAGQLEAAGMRLDAFIANRVLACPPLTSPDEVAAAIRAASPGRTDPSGPAIEALAHSLLYARAIAESQAEQLARIRNHGTRAPIIEIPLLSHEVGGFDALRTIGERLSP